MGNIRGRLCLLYQIDWETDTLSYFTSTKSGKLSGSVSSEDEFIAKINELMEFHASDRIELALKFFTFKNSISGICPKSFPKTHLSQSLISLINISVGGESGVQLVQLPYSGALTDQPNVFLQAYSIFVDEHYKWMAKKRREDESKNKR